MITSSVLPLLLFDLFVFLVAALLLDKSPRRWESFLLSSLFFLSGMPALIYQVVWQRTLFSIYGVNAESVAVVVGAFMLGLGLGSLIGGRLSTRYPNQGILFFGLAEIGIAGFGLASLPIFHWAATFTAGAKLPSVVLFSLALLLIPTLLMGATLPLLVEHLVRRSLGVGSSVSMLYGVNTLGSAVACYLCANFLLRDFGQSGSVLIAASVNTLVGATAYLAGRKFARKFTRAPAKVAEPIADSSGLSLRMAMLIAGLSGFVALGFEIAWFRIFSLASADRAPAFALLLATYLAGVAAGSFLLEKFTRRSSSAAVIHVAGALLLVAGALASYLPPLVAAIRVNTTLNIDSGPAFFLTAALLGSVLPLLCRLALASDARVGRGVSLVYLSNILGSTIGSLGIGFILMQYFGLRQVSQFLSVVAILTGGVLLFFGQRKFSRPPAWTAVLFVAALVAVPASSPLYFRLFEKLIFGAQGEQDEQFVHIVENRNGVIAVTKDAAVFGSGVYDGFFNIDPVRDVNFVIRAYSLSAFHPAPKHMLMIGLSSGSWGQILANHPQVESLDVVEINPGYLQLIRQYPMVRSLLSNPKVHLYVDDGRRWLLAHPQAHYDVIVTNTTYYWRDHSTGLLSVEYLQLIRKHLNPGGIYYFNTTDSLEVFATALHIYPYGMRVMNFLIVGDSPINVSKENWLAALSRYTIDNKKVFDLDDPAVNKVLGRYMDFADTVNRPRQFMSLESGDSVRRRIGGRQIITDDNMGAEWRNDVRIPWHVATSN